jgi:hypothetical protein
MKGSLSSFKALGSMSLGLRLRGQHSFDSGGMR